MTARIDEERHRPPPRLYKHVFPLDTFRATRRRRTTAAPMTSLARRHPSDVGPPSCNELRFADVHVATQTTILFSEKKSTVSQLDGSERSTKSRKRRAREVGSGLRGAGSRVRFILSLFFFSLRRTFTLPTAEPRTLNHRESRSCRAAEKLATRTCQTAAFVRGIIGLIILSRTHAYPRRSLRDTRERTLCVRTSLCYLPAGGTGSGRYILRRD